MQFIDQLWADVKATGANDSEKGYLLNRISARLSADWNQSALVDRPNADADMLQNDDSVFARAVAPAADPHPTKSTSSHAETARTHVLAVDNEPASSSSSRDPRYVPRSVSSRNTQVASSSSAASSSNAPRTLPHPKGHAIKTGPPAKAIGARQRSDSVTSTTSKASGRSARPDRLSRR